MRMGRIQTQQRNPEEIGEYLSALSNSACYHEKDYAYLVYGVENITHRLVGTTFHPLRDQIKGHHNYTMASKIIADTIKAELIKDQSADSKSKKFAKYVPYWVGGLMS